MLLPWPASMISNHARSPAVARSLVSRTVGKCYTYLGHSFFNLLIMLGQPLVQSRQALLGELNQHVACRASPLASSKKAEKRWTTSWLGFSKPLLCIPCMRTSGSRSNRIPAILQIISPPLLDSLSSSSTLPSQTRDPSCKFLHILFRQKKLHRVIISSQLLMGLEVMDEPMACSTEPCDVLQVLFAMPATFDDFFVNKPRNQMVVRQGDPVPLANLASICTAGPRCWRRCDQSLDVGSHHRNQKIVCRCGQRRVQGWICGNEIVGDKRIGNTGWQIENG